MKNRGVSCVVLDKPLVERSGVVCANERCTIAKAPYLDERFQRSGGRFGRIGKREFNIQERAIEESDTFERHFSESESAGFVGTQTDIQPMVSIVARFFTKMLCFAMRFAMIVRDKATQTGKPCGTKAVKQPMELIMARREIGRQGTTERIMYVVHSL